MSFTGAFGISTYSHKLIAFLDRVQDNSLQKRSIASVEDGVSGADTKLDPFVDDSMGSGTFWRKYTTLLNREFTLAKRDPALFYLQAFLLLGFGFLVGAAFLRLKYKIDTSIYNVQSSTLWLVMMMIYIQIFKVRYEVGAFDLLHDCFCIFICRILSYSLRRNSYYIRLCQK